MVIMTEAEDRPGYEELLCENEQLRAEVERVKQGLAEFERQTQELDRADRLRLQGDFDGALKMLDQMQDSDPVSALRQRAVQERRQVGMKAYAEARKMMREFRVAQAIELFQTVPADLKDTQEDIRAARQLHARTVARMKSRAKIDSILVALAVAAALVGILVRFL